MKKYSRIIALIMVFCLIFPIAAFAASGEGEAADQASERPDGEWSRICRQMPFAPGHGFGIVDLGDIAWKSGEYSGRRSQDRIPTGMPNFNNPKELPLLILVIGFNNIDYSGEYDWGETIFEGEDSLANYYKDMSFNQFEFVPANESSAYNVGGNTNKADSVNDGVVHVKLDSDHDDWYRDDDAVMSNYCSALVDAIRKADDYVDFASFDKNDDGRLTTDEIALGVVVAGYEGAYGTYPEYGETNYLWSFAWNLYSGWYYYFSDQYTAKEFLPYPDDVLVDNYITIAEELKPGNQEPISVLAHELGHYLGLPDLYDTDYSMDDQNASLDLYPWMYYDAASLSVMCSGSWGWDGEKYIPGAFDAWSRTALGWVEPETAEAGIYDVSSDQGEYSVLRIETGVDGEFYLLENREYAGWDRILASWRTEYSQYADNGGLVLWHIDDEIYESYGGNNSVNNTDHRPGVMPLYPEEDGNGDVTFIGTLDYPTDIKQPFFNYDIWQDRYAGDLGIAMDLPVYNKCSKPSERSYSGVDLQILEPVKDHSVRVKLGDVPLYINSVAVSSSSEYGHTGSTVTFEAEVKGTAPHEVTWSLYGSNSTGTKLVEGDSNSGISLEIAEDETAETLTVRATSVYDLEKYGEATIKIAESEAIYSVSVYADEESCLKGSGVWLSAYVEGDADKSVIWSISGNSSDSTCLRDEDDQEAYLFISDDETSDRITVRATSVFDPSKYGEDSVTVVHPVVDSVEITAEFYECHAPAVCEIEAAVIGKNVSLDVNWSLYGSNSENTNLSLLDTNGMTRKAWLVVAEDEPAGELTVRATSEYDASKYGEVTIRILGDGDPDDPGDETGIDRVAGPNRYQTAFEAADRLKKELGVSEFENVVIASGLDFPDALAGAYLAKAKNAPVLLTNAGMAPSVAQYVKNNMASGGTVYILGGAGAVPEVMETSLSNLGVRGVVRLAGSNRYMTNIEILKAAGVEGEDILVCSGKGYADSLSASAVGKPILLVGDALLPAQKDYLDEIKGSISGSFYAIGGSGAVSEKVFGDLKAYASGDTERVAGLNRYATSVEVAKTFFPEKVSRIVLAYARNYPDGLAGGPVAYALDAPLILVTDTVYADAEVYAAGAGTNKATIMGGAALISDETALEIIK
ncbi:MAG: cell wall-binding repeat-containing protein [Clostridia bacterium]|nr:cell wall-binding repeat-containing protein [Clostridia bacterium]